LKSASTCVIASAATSSLLSFRSRYFVPVFEPIYFIMAPQSKQYSIPGVAEGRKIGPIPTGEDVSAEDRVKALLHGISTSDEDSYKVSSVFFNASVTCSGASRAAFPRYYLCRIQAGNSYEGMSRPEKLQHV